MANWKTAYTTRIYNKTKEVFENVIVQKLRRILPEDMYQYRIIKYSDQTIVLGEIHFDWYRRIGNEFYTNGGIINRSNLFYYYGMERTEAIDKVCISLIETLNNEYYGIGSELIKIAKNFSLIHNNTYYVDLCAVSEAIGFYFKIGFITRDETINIKIKDIMRNKTVEHEIQDDISKLVPSGCYMYIP